MIVVDDRTSTRVYTYRSVRIEYPKARTIETFKSNGRVRESKREDAIHIE